MMDILGAVVSFNCILYMYKFLLYKQLSDYFGLLTVDDNIYNVYGNVVYVFFQLVCIRILYGYLCNRIEQMNLTSLNGEINKLVNRILSYNIDYYKTNSNTRVSNLWKFIDSNDTLMTKLCIELPKIVTFILYFSYLIYMYSYVAFFIIIPMNLLCLRLLLPLFKKHYLEYNNMNSLESVTKNKLLEVYCNMEKIKLYNQGVYEKSKIIKLFNDYFGSKICDKKYVFYISLATDLISEFFIFVIYMVGVSMIFNNMIKPIDILYLAVHTGNFYYNLVQLRDLYINHKKTLQTINTSRNNLLYDKYDDIEANTDIHINRDKTKLVFNNVCFGYDDRLVLDNLSFELLANNINLVLGQNGSGKSTIIKLLLKIYDVKSGSIDFFGSELQTIPTSYIRDKITLISHEYNLFDDTVWENITYGLNSIDNIDNVCDMLEASDWLANNKDRQIGFRGNNLTLGEKKKIQLINAICRDTPIIVFDEPSNSLDSHALQWFMSFVKKLRDEYNKTIIIMSHDMRLIGLEDHKVSI